MIKHRIKINNGVEAFGTSGKTITAEEIVDNCDSAELAREITEQAEVVKPRTCEFVLDNTLAAVAEKMSEGKAVVLTINGKAAVRIYPDVHLKCGSINEAKARELGFEEITTENVADIVAKAGGVTVRARVEVEQPLTEALRELKPQLKLVEKVEIPYVARKENQGGSNNQGGGNNGGNNGSDSDENVLG